MATLNIVNLTNSPIYLATAYVTLDAGESIALVRFLPDMIELKSIMDLRDSGSISINVVIESWELEWQTLLAGNLALSTTTRPYHAPIVSASIHSALPGTQPTPNAVGALFYLNFSLNNDAAWRQFKIPTSYVENPAAHIHWTKSGNSNEQGKTARWRLTYVVFDGISEDGSITPTTVEFEGTYLDNGTTNRIIYRSTDLPLIGFVAGHYVSLKIEAITPVGTPLSSLPALFSVDLTYTEKINL